MKWIGVAIGLLLASSLVFDGNAGTSQKSGQSTQQQQQKQQTRVQQTKPSTGNKAASQKNSTNAASLKGKYSQQHRQAAHAWTRHKKEFQKMGIKNSNQLRKKISDVRNNPQLKRNLSGGRKAYGQYTNGNKGIIVVDNKSAKNGGTAFTSGNIRNRMRKLK